MAGRENEKKRKGKFGGLALAVAKKYVYPDPRRAAIALGALAAVSVLGFFIFDSSFLQSSLTTSGPLSSYHATFEKDCSSCHVKFQSVTNANCSVCHEKAGDKLGIYTLAAHQVYRSGDLKRVKSPHEEQACVLCHQEHKGREAEITNVTDAQCIVCHEYGSFNKEHPQFEFAAKQVADDSTLKFTHIRHVQEVVKREKLVDVERACLYCHNPQPEGKRFAPIAFETHCQTCHLTTNVETPALRMASAEEPGTPGVITLEAMRTSGSPRAMTAAFISPNDFVVKPGNRLVKTRVYHEDPWIMENLRRLREKFYPAGEFDELLKTSGTLSSSNQMLLSRQVYEEALETLQSYAAGLRGRPEPEVQLELVRVDSLLKATRNKLQRAGLDAHFMTPAMKKSDARNEEVDDFVNNLTKPCQECHMVSEASIRRVQQDQAVLARAEFNHRAHILQTRCLDCHNEIPVLVATNGSATNGSATNGLATNGLATNSLATISSATNGSATNSSTTSGALLVPKNMDRSAIQNLPRIENCRTCHNAEETSNRCVTCHVFHPNKTQRTSMLLYLY
jgi:hypothetical protein